MTRLVCAALATLLLVIPASARRAAATSDLERLRALVLAGDLPSAYAIAAAHADERTREGVEVWDRAYHSLMVSAGRPEGDLVRTVNLVSVAMCLRLDDLALACSKAMVESRDERYGRTLHYEGAYAAGVVSMRTKRYDQAVEWFERMKEACAASYTGDAENADACLRAARAYASGKPAAGALLDAARTVWVRDSMIGGTYFDEAFAALDRALALHPAADLEREIRALQQRYAQAIYDAAAAERYAAAIVKQFPTQEVADEAAVNLGSFFLETGKPQDAVRWLAPVAESDRWTGAACNARLVLARAYEGLGETERRVATLVRLHADEPASDRPWGQTARAEASRELGRYYEATGDFERALQYYADWRPRGTSDAGPSDYWRDAAMARCLIALGRADEAVRDHLLPQLMREEIEGSDGTIAAETVAVYERRDALPELIAAVDPYVKRDGDNITGNFEAYWTEELAKIRMLVKRRAAGELVERIAPMYPERDGTFASCMEQDRETVAICRGLAECGDEAFGALRRRFETPGTTYAQRAWLLYAIALHPAPGAQDYLDDLKAKAARGTNVGVGEADLAFVGSLRPAR